MLRRFLVTLIRRSLLILLLVCVGCVAQSAPPDVARKIEHQVRSFYTIPADVKVTVGAITPSTEMQGYDAVSVNIPLHFGAGSDRANGYFNVGGDGIEGAHLVLDFASHIGRRG